MRLDVVDLVDFLRFLENDKGLILKYRCTKYGDLLLGAVRILRVACSCGYTVSRPEVDECPEVSKICPVLQVPGPVSNLAVRHKTFTRYGVRA